MGSFYRSGRLISAETIRPSGVRTLAAATESDLWSGVAATRPWPASEQLRIVSTSAEDDNVKTQSGTITIAGTMDTVVTQSNTITVAGTMQPVLTDEWDSVLGGAHENNDVARLTLNGVHYDTVVTAAIPNVAALANEIATSAMSGSFDIWSVLPGGVLDAGDIITLTVPGATASPYAYTVQLADTAALVSAGLKALVDADGGATYTAVVGGSTLFLTKTARGVGVTITATFTTDPGLNATSTVAHIVTGVAGQTAWNVVSDGVNTVTSTHATSGVTADTVASSFIFDAGAASTFVSTHTVTGAAADIARVTLNGTAYSRTISNVDTADTVATALAATLHALPAVNAAAVGAVITVTAATAGTAGAYTLVDSSVNNQAGGVALSCTVASVAVGANADIIAVSDGTTTYSRTVTTAVLADEVTALAATINAAAAYIASSIAGVITVSAAVPGVGFTFVDAKTDNQNADLTVTVNNTANMANGGGTGLRTLRIAYLDGDGAEQVETVTMDGLTPVLTAATDVTSITSITGASFGSTGAAVGAVSVKDVAAAAIFGTVSAALTQDESATYRVPVRKKAYIASLDLSAGAVATTVKLKSDCNPATGAVQAGATFVWGTAVVGTDPVTVTPATAWGPFPAAAKVWLTGTSAAGTVCQGSMNGYLEPAQ